MSKVWKIAAGLLLALLPFLVTGCSGVRKIKDIQVKSVGVKYITPTSQRSAEGVLLLEIGCGQAQAVTGLLKEAGFSDPQVVRDTAGRDRVVIARYAHV